MTESPMDQDFAAREKQIEQASRQLAEDRVRTWYHGPRPLTADTFPGKPDRTRNISILLKLMEDDVGTIKVLTRTAGSDSPA